MERALRVAACGLLVAILAVQICILRRMPPTLGEVQAAKGETFKQLLLQQPVVYARVKKIEEPVTIEGEVTVYRFRNIEPLEVKIDNEPLEVRPVR